ncbi:plexin B-like protein [Dinothrombium tinctorium]|uniref:Plexin B-like protein n=1 Tax=Dinothrombium tinctorium TaxID=1965070 RepID=A0A3S3P4J3_9ACAR|nr:plexin B-like protein [Dinothrombium tinctorium]RWS12026.1 plexin B-like protein [Dinothrombium tinctorium]
MKKARREIGLWRQHLDIEPRSRNIAFTKSIEAGRECFDSCSGRCIGHSTSSRSSGCHASRSNPSSPNACGKLARCNSIAASHTGYQTKLVLDGSNFCLWSSLCSVSNFTKCLLIIQTLLMCHSIHASTNVIVNSYSTNNGTINFTHVAYDPQADRLYVGASNWLYQFNATLFLELAVKTGPVDDSPLCSPKDCEGVETVPTTNVNKVLVIDKQSQKLIVCGSVHQGACQRHVLDDITKREELIPLPVAANDENSSTFAFIGPAKYFGGHITPVLYVATTNSRLGPYRDMVPAISSRSLESSRLFSIIEKEFSDNARLDFNFHLRDYYLVSYIYGFHVNDFVYFATVQKRSHLRALEEWGYITRLARVCSSDIAYNTYTEVTLECLGADGTEYTLLQDATIIRAGSDLARDLGINYGDKALIGVFSTSKDHTSRPSGRSALCVYSIKQIEQKFIENIHLCYNGSVATRNMDYIAGNIENCPQPGRGGNVNNFCSETLRLNGSIPISTTAAIAYENTTLTAVTAVTVSQHNVVFMGTSSGHLKKLLLSRARLGEEFEDIEVHAGNAILADIYVDRSQQYIYVASPYKSIKLALINKLKLFFFLQLSKVSIERCDHYNSCRECLQARNPYCGWCSLEKRCTVKAVCYNTTGWGSYDKSSSNSRWLSLDTQQCIGFQSIRPERLPITKVETIELAINELPRLPSTAHYLCVFGDGPPIPAKVTRKGLLCTTPPPHLRPKIPAGKDHVVVDLAVRSTETKTDFLHRPYDNFHCLVEYEDSRIKVAAKVDQNRIICRQTSYSYKTDVSSLQASLTLIWNSDTLIDKTNVTLYKCHLLGSHSGKADCSLCQTIRNKYHCVWCSGQCSYASDCSELPASTCPRPRIDWIHPLSGPVEGGTLVTIEGSNLGSSVEEIRDQITIGGVPCVPVEYTVSVRVVCRTGPSENGANSSIILVGNKAGVTKAQEKFQYKSVRLSDVNPKVGPQSGGTVVYLTGSNFNIGSNIEVFFDDLVCDIKKTTITNKQISCRTPSSPFAPYTVETLRVVIDGANLTLYKPFTFIEDPKITSFSPKKSFFSGGRRVTVTGVNFSSIQQPKMGVFNHHSLLINETMCTVVNDTLMHCPSPSVEREVENLIRINDKSDELEFKFRIGFEMDNVQSVRELQNFFPQLDAHLIYVSDPKFFHFKSNGIKMYKGESLVIEGENLRLALTEVEVNVTIGSRLCNITSLTMTQLVCLPPEIQPPDEKHELPAVVVSVGSSLSFKVGHLKYDMDIAYEVPPLLIGLISALGALLMLLSLVLLAIFRHKSSQAEREYKRIQLQMDTLENGVRLECKQAFAELQTDLTDINNDIQTTGIPVLDHKTYIMKIFFPGLSENPLSGTFKVSYVRDLNSYNAFFGKQLNGHSTYGEHTMAQFQELLYTRSFLLTFVNTLENQNSFTIRDRVNVASLLMIILSDKMDYAFTILRDLLLKLIDQYANSKHPQLLLRRTEFVVEKMLVNWLALCMYHNIKEDAGRSLFLLFSAIKHQIEKGPIDAITHDARYSLSEERLLREQIEYFTLLINVVHEGWNEPLQCRVLDCDTISQTKAKILDAMYKNTPVSERPSADETDLEWHESPNRRILLFDEDITTKTVNGWRRVNTLSHYGVKDGALMSLIISRKDTNSVYPKISSNSPSLSPTEQSLSHYSNIYYTLTKRSPNYRNKNCDNNVRYWHLVKNVDEASSRNSKDHHQTHKAIPEIFLTRLLSTKGTIQKYVDDFFASILTVNDKLPPAVKWLFDLFDRTASEHGITDPEVVHAWKCNSLPLRFWVNLVKNPDFVFDIEKSPSVDSCLSVVAQAFMDACSTSEHRLGKESPSSKLLFARDMPSYRRMVTKYYYDVAQSPRVSDEYMINLMKQMSSFYGGEMDISNAVRQLYVYITRYREELLEALYSDVNCEIQHYI